MNPSQADVIKTIKPGRHNIFFVPIDSFDILTRTDGEIREYAPDKGFNPLFIHQNFDGEVIVGWNDDLVIAIFYHPYSLHFFVKILGTLSAVESTREDREKAQLKLIERLTTSIGRVYTCERHGSPNELYRNLLMTDLQSYKDAVMKYVSFPVYGELMGVSKSSGGQIVEIYRQKFPADPSILDSGTAPTSTRLNPFGDSFNGFHRRFEFLMHFFIESCSAILNSSSWTISTAFVCDPSTASDQDRADWTARGVLGECPRTSQVDPSTSPSNGRSAAAFVSVFSYLGLESHRVRISQFFTIPPHQGQGIASMLLRNLYDRVQSDNTISEISVEDPAHAFMQMRDVVGLQCAIDKRVLPLHCLFPNEVVDKKRDPITNDYDSPLWGQDGGGAKDRLLHLPDQRYLNYSTEETQKQALPGLFSKTSIHSNSLLASSTKAFIEVPKNDLTKNLESLRYLSDYLQSIYDLARYKLRESRIQCVRLVELLLLAKYLPHVKQQSMIVTPAVKRQKLGGSSQSADDKFVPNAFKIHDPEIARSYRLCPVVTEDVARRWADDPLLAPVKLFVKMRILNESDVEVGTGSAMTQDEMLGARDCGDLIQSIDSSTKKLIHKQWCKILYSHIRTLTKLRYVYSNRS
eukprot:GHVH01007769.1.p2 GENE.GHVH01007769.1~~GHVH01007769.1.p2  ORF type:complete len:651 (+),score=101.69 GHVH01007769.1:52-1953(+)